jgi:hypothetical protein
MSQIVLLTFSCLANLKNLVDGKIIMIKGKMSLEKGKQLISREEMRVFL